jgi:hypothetical protein
MILTLINNVPVLGHQLHIFAALIGPTLVAAAIGCCDVSFPLLSRYFALGLTLGLAFVQAFRKFLSASAFTSDILSANFYYIFADSPSSGMRHTIVTPLSSPAPGIESRTRPTMSRFLTSSSSRHAKYFDIRQVQTRELLMPSLFLGC